MKKITQSLSLRLRLVNPQPPTPSVVAFPTFPQLKGHIFTVAKFPSSLKRTFVLLTQQADTDQRPGHSVCHSGRGREEGEVLTWVCVGGVCVLAVRPTSNINPSSKLCALNTHHFSCMWSVMQVVQQFQQDPEREKPNIFPCLFTLTKHISGTGPLMMSHHLCFCSFSKIPKKWVVADCKQRAKHTTFSNTNYSAWMKSRIKLY